MMRLFRRAKAKLTVMQTGVRIDLGDSIRDFNAVVVQYMRTQAINDDLLSTTSLLVNCIKNQSTFSEDQKKGILDCLNAAYDKLEDSQFKLYLALTFQVLGHEVNEFMISVPQEAYIQSFQEKTYFESTRRAVQDGLSLADDYFLHFDSPHAPDDYSSSSSHELS